jgi:hypothetical protein
MMAWMKTRNEHTTEVQSAANNMWALLEVAANARNEKILDRDVIAHLTRVLEEIARDEGSPWATKANEALAWAERERNALEVSNG